MEKGQEIEERGEEEREWRRRSRKEKRGGKRREKKEKQKHRGERRVLGGRSNIIFCMESVLEVTSSGGRVKDGQLQLLVWSNDEDTTSCQGKTRRCALIWVQHAQLDSKVSFLISNDWVWKFIHFAVSKCQDILGSEK